MSKDIPAPNYTQIPNAVLDRMHEMDNQTFRVVMALCRQTFGWHKQRDKVSITQLIEITGMSRQGVLNGIKTGMSMEIIKRSAVSARRQDGFYYRIKVVNVVDHPQDAGSQRSRPQVVNDVDHEVVNDVDLQKKELNKLKETKCVSTGTPQPRTEATAPVTNGTHTRQPQPITTSKIPPTTPATTTAPDNRQAVHEFIDASMEYLGKTLDWQMQSIRGWERQSIVAFANVQIAKGRTPEIIQEFDRKWPAFCGRADGETPTRATLKQFMSRFDDVLNFTSREKTNGNHNPQHRVTNGFETAYQRSTRERREFISELITPNS